MTASTPTFVCRSLCAVTLALTLPAAWAWTDKPVKMVVPAPAGGTMDVVARVVAEQLSADIGQPVIIENKPGAGGGIGVQALNAAPADGNTIMMTASNVLTEIPHVLKSGFDPLKDVKPVTAIARSSLVLIGAPSVPAKDVKALVAWVKTNPGKTSFASYSAGSVSHYAGMILNQKAGLDMQHVPFAGSPPALQQVLGGQIPIMFDGMATTKPLAAGNKVQVFGVAAKVRSPHLPNVPTMAEQGYPEMDYSNWVGVIVAAGVPAATVDKINAAVVKAAGAAKVRDRLVAAGFEMEPLTPPAQLSASVKTEFDRNAAIVKQFNITLQ
jgi:tripartite-type tricarboxylate transporter receptor subunit TctC